MSSLLRSDQITGQVPSGSSREVPADPSQPPGSQPYHILRRTEVGPAPLSFAQERFWYLDQIDPGAASAHLSRSWKVAGQLDYNLLRQSLASVVERQDSLRATFAATQLYAGVDGKPAQLISNEGKAELLVIDMSGVTPNQRLGQAQQYARGEAQQGFDLTIGPLLRVTLLSFARDEHILLVTVHRIISDDQSLNLFFDELWQSYSALASGAAIALRPLPIHFADYASWERNTLTEDTLRSDSDYWRQVLQGAPAVLELAAGGPRPAIQSWRGKSFTTVLDEELGAALLALTFTERATLFEVLMAAFLILLARYSRQDDLVIGSEFPNREFTELEYLIGPFANAVGLRTDLSGNPTFREWLKQVQQRVQDAAQHQRMPFAKLVRDLELERSLSFAPIFQVALNLREAKDFALPAAGLVLEELALDPEISRIDLTLEVLCRSSPGIMTPLPEANEIQLRFEYNLDLFEPATVTRMSAHFEVLLRAIVSDPDQRIGDLPILTSPELQTTLIAWNQTGTCPRNGACLHEMFAAAAAKMPHEIALVAGTERLTYSELNRRANQLAHYLQSLGIGPEKLVGVYLERSINNIVSLLAVLKAGGAYVPIDPAYPQDRVTFMLSDSAVAVLITQRSLAGNLPAQPAAVVLIDEDWQRVAASSEQSPAVLATPDNLAYVIYTSGSTGRPKGVSVTHQSVAHLFAATREQLGFREGDIWSTVHSSAFDFSVWEIWGALLYGGRLVVVPLEVTQSPSAFHELLLNEGVTILNQTPSALRQLLDAEPDPASLHLRTIICGGDALDCELAETLARLSIPVWNFYGPTESTVWATCTKIGVEPTAAAQSAGRDAEIKSPSAACLTAIGRPLSDITIYILDDNLHPVPPGVPGEICIGGAGLARGYLNRPELTAERFVPSPFARDLGERLYRTGDLGRHLRDGRVEFLGRLDNQIKLRGFRIELGEIEAVLSQHPEVDQAVVTIREDRPGDKRLVAYVVPHDALLPSPPGQEWPFNLRQLLAAKLPEYMMPAAFVRLDSLPLTPNRKVDRRALPKPAEGRLGLESSYLAPRDNLEQQLANIWEKILDIKTIGVHDSFFQLGGHSLLAVRLFSQIENRFGKRLPLSVLFQAPTIEQLANVLREAAANTSDWSSLVAIQPQGSNPPLYCIHAAGANVLIYRPLSRHLGNDQPVYALQARGLDGQQRPFLRVEEMAAHYIREIQAFQPAGPYHLLGASFGGLVIFEMALQLWSQGHQVGLLAMLNTNCPVYPRSRKVRLHLTHLREHGAAFYSRAIWQTLRRKMGKPTVSVEINAGPDPALARLVAERRHGDEALVRTVLAILDAEKDYVPRDKIYPGKITMFWALDAEADEEDNRLGWEKLARGGLEVHVVPGTHTSIREEPHVAVLAEELRHCLAAAEQRKQV